MQKSYCLFLVVLMFISACKKDGSNSTCDKPTPLFKIDDKNVNVEIQYGPANSAFEVEYGATGFTQGSGTTLTLSSYNFSFVVTVYGNYDVYVRRKCDGNNSDWVKSSINVDGTSYSCRAPSSLNFNLSIFPPQFEWYGWSANFYDVEYGPTGFQIGNGTRIRTNNSYITEAILHMGITYDFYVRANCGGSKFSTWSGPQSIYASQDLNVSVPCTTPTNLYAYKINTHEINYTSTGHGNISYEISFSTSSSVNTGNIIETSSANGTVGNPGGFSGTYYFWIRGKCDNGSFTSWAVSQVQ